MSQLKSVQPGEMAESLRLEALRLLGHQPALDGLRGIAILVVVAFHSSSAFLPGGHAGVDVFFALSGFLITVLLLEELATTGRISLLSFYARRALRLLPALALLVLVHVAYCTSFYEGWDRKAGLASALAASLYVSNWCMAFRLFPMGGLSHTWSLAVEEQFYLVWPPLLILILALARSRLRTLYILATLPILVVASSAIMTYQGVPSYRLYYGFDTRADALLIGCCTALIYQLRLIRDDSRWAWITGAMASVSAVLLCLFFLWGPEPRSPEMSYGIRTLVAFASGLVILAIASHFPGIQALTRVLQWSVLVWIGKLSYGLYLWHYFILWVFAEQLGSLPIAIKIALALLLSVLVSTSSYCFVEKPFLRLKNRFAWQTAVTRRQQSSGNISEAEPIQPGTRPGL